MSKPDKKSLDQKNKHNKTEEKKQSNRGHQGGHDEVPHPAADAQSEFHHAEVLREDKE